MKFFVDKDSCVESGACEGVYPEVFSMNDNGLAIVIYLDIAEDISEVAQDVCDRCPARAISSDN